jgi:hypothetical protein
MSIDKTIKIHVKGNKLQGIVIDVINVPVDWEYMWDEVIDHDIEEEDK